MCNHLINLTHSFGAFQNPNLQSFMLLGTLKEKTWAVEIPQFQVSLPCNLEYLSLVHTTPIESWCGAHTCDFSTVETKIGRLFQSLAGQPILCGSGLVSQQGR